MTSTQQDPWLSPIPAFAPPPQRRWGAAFGVAGGATAVLILLWIGIALLGSLAGSARHRAASLEPHLGHLVVVTGHLINVDDPGLPVYRGVYEVSVPQAGGAADVVVNLEGESDWAFSAAEADLPARRDFLVDERDAVVLGSGRTSTLTVPQRADVEQLHTRARLLTIWRWHFIAQSLTVVVVAAWWIDKLLRRPEAALPR